MNKPLSSYEDTSRIADRPQVIYLGLQKTGSSYLRGYFTSHPDIIWTRAAGCLLSADGAKSYPDAARTALAVELGKKSMAGIAQPLWIDMHESAGLGYRFLPGHEWRADPMFSTAPLLNGEIDPSPADYFRSLHETCPDARILLTVRNQADWMFSNYHHFIRHMPAGRRAFADFLQTVEGRILASTAHYDRLVERLHDAFGRERVHVIPLEAIEKSPEDALRNLSVFLGKEYVPFEPSKKDLNVGADRSRGSGTGRIRMFVRPSGESGNYVRMFAQGLQGLLKGELAVSMPSKAQLSTQYGGVLASQYAMSNVRLERLTGLNLAALGYPV